MASFSFKTSYTHDACIRLDIKKLVILLLCPSAVFSLGFCCFCEEAVYLVVCSAISFYLLSVQRGFGVSFFFGGMFLETYLLGDAV